MVLSLWGKKDFSFEGFLSGGKECSGNNLVVLFHISCSLQCAGCYYAG